MKKCKPSVVHIGGILFISLFCMSSALGQISMPILEKSTDISRDGEIVWIDYVTSDAKEGKKFFKELFGWKYKDHGVYSLALSNHKPVAGVLEDSELVKGAKNGYWVVSASVKDVKATSEKIKAKGGKIISASMEIAGRGSSAFVEDGQGAFFSILHSSSGDPKATAAKNGEWMWVELWTADPQSAASFYSEVFNVSQRKSNDAGDENYFILKGKVNDFAGITSLPVKDEAPIWVPVLKVDNAQSIADQAVELGGSILINPTEISGNKVALIATPFGAPFLIQEWEN